MGYEFAGFFAATDDHVLRAAQTTWPGCHTRTITSPFEGIGVAVPVRVLTYGGDTAVEYERAIEMWHSMDADLPNWSRTFPGITFVYLRVSCFGGWCDHQGYACRDGQVLDRVDHLDDDAPSEVQDDTLRRLVRYLGVELGEPLYFEPLTRGFFSA